MDKVAPKASELWQQMRIEAGNLSEMEPVLASFYHAAILNHHSFTAALGYQLASAIGCDSVPAMLIREVAAEAYAEAPELVEDAVADCVAHYVRDPACDLYTMPFLYLKGFQALQVFRISHFLWQKGRRGLALFLQNRISSKFDVDIHPAACIGRGIMIDHATGVVIGETATVGDNVSMLHGVTLGGCGLGPGRRHPAVGNGVLISTGAKLLGAITVGRGAKIAAGSLVLEDVAAHTTVAGVPAKPVGRLLTEDPALDMDQQL